MNQPGIADMGLGWWGPTMHLIPYHLTMHLISALLGPARGPADNSSQPAEEQTSLFEAQYHAQVVKDTQMLRKAVSEVRITTPSACPEVPACLLRG